MIVNSDPACACYVLGGNSWNLKGCGALEGADVNTNQSVFRDRDKRLISTRATLSKKLSLTAV